MAKRICLTNLQASYLMEVLEEEKKFYTDKLKGECDEYDTEYCTVNLVWCESILKKLYGESN